MRHVYNTSYNTSCADAHLYTTWAAQTHVFFMPCMRAAQTCVFMPCTWAAQICVFLPCTWAVQTRVVFIPRTQAAQKRVVFIHYRRVVQTCLSTTFVSCADTRHYTNRAAQIRVITRSAQMRLFIQRDLRKQASSSVLKSGGSAQTVWGFTALFVYNMQYRASRVTWQKWNVCWNHDASSTSAIGDGWWHRLSIHPYSPKVFCVSYPYQRSIAGPSDINVTQWFNHNIPLLKPEQQWSIKERALGLGSQK